jgi:hypothetical protein
MKASQEELVLANTSAHSVSNTIHFSHSLKKKSLSESVDMNFDGLGHDSGTLCVPSPYFALVRW